jgi:hypothetical protein
MGQTIINNSYETYLLLLAEGKAQVSLGRGRREM